MWHVCGELEDGDPTIPQMKFLWDMKQKKLKKQPFVLREALVTSRPAEKNVLHLESSETNIQRNDSPEAGSNRDAKKLNSTVTSRTGHDGCSWWAASPWRSLRNESRYSR